MNPLWPKEVWRNERPDSPFWEREREQEAEGGKGEKREGKEGTKGREGEGVGRRKERREGGGGGGKLKIGSIY